ncbi:hypothetical protein C0J52_05110 [Blattella germanica]|nr:hypothetical protein C0J52_05110 [Blattella germanica]
MQIEESEDNNLDTKMWSDPEDVKRSNDERRFLSVNPFLAMRWLYGRLLLAVESARDTTLVLRAMRAFPIAKSLQRDGWMDMMSIDEIQSRICSLKLRERERHKRQGCDSTVLKGEIVLRKIEVSFANCTRLPAVTLHVSVLIDLLVSLPGVSVPRNFGPDIASVPLHFVRHLILGLPGPLSPSLGSQTEANRLETYTGGVEQTVLIMPLCSVTEYYDRNLELCRIAIEAGQFVTFDFVIVRFNESRKLQYESTVYPKCFRLNSEHCFGCINFTQEVMDELKDQIKYGKMVSGNMLHAYSDVAIGGLLRELQ